MTHNKAIQEFKTTEILKTLLAVNTSQPIGNEKKLISKILELMPSDANYEIIDHGDDRASLVIKVEGSEKHGGIAFIGHMDTVACGDENEWKHNPFSATMDEGRIYGRGAADMKGGLVAMITVADYLLNNRIKLKSDIYFCFTADEESKGTGAVALSKYSGLKNVNEVVICEPSNMKIGIAEKGVIWFRVNVKGKLAHGSRPEIGVNAIEKITEFEMRLKNILLNGEIHPLLGSNTLSVTSLNGGIMTNVIPDKATMEMDIRLLPSAEIQKIIEASEKLAVMMMEESENLSIKVDVINSRAAVETLRDNPFVKKFEEVCINAGFSPEMSGLYFYTDAAQIVPVINKPFIIFGPGDDAMAHVKDEYIYPESISQVANIYLDYIIKNLS